MTTYLWDDTNRPALGDMASTTALSDLGAGDNTTYVTSTDSLSFGAGCSDHLVDTWLTGAADLESNHSLTAWEFTCRLRYDNGDNITCALPFLEFGDEYPFFLGQRLTYWVETSADGSTWTQTHTGQVSLATEWPTVSGSFAGGSEARYARVVLYAEHGFYDQSDTIQVWIDLSDFRLTATAIEDEEEEADPDTYNLSTAETQILLFGKDGKRRTLPQRNIRAANWEIITRGGYGDCSLSLLGDVGAFSYIEPDDKIQVWVRGGGRAQCRYEGYVDTIDRSRSRPDEIEVRGVGLWQRISKIHTDREYLHPSDTDVGLFLSEIVQDYVVSLYPDLKIEINEIGETMGNLDARGRTVGQVVEDLLALVGDRATYGVDRTDTGKPRLYLRKWDESPTHTIDLSGQKRYGVVEASTNQDIGDLCTRLRLRGGVPRYPNLVPNASFEDLRFNNEQDSILGAFGSFETGFFWSLEGGASRKSSGLDEGQAHHGRWMVELDNAGEKFSKTLTFVDTFTAAKDYVAGCHVKRELQATPSTGTLTIEWLDASDVVLDSLVVDLEPESVYWTRFQDITQAPSGTKKIRVTGERTSGSILVDSVYVYGIGAARQSGWNLEQKGTGRVKSISWAWTDALHGGYSVRIATTGCTDLNNSVILKSSKYPVTGGESLTMGIWRKSPAGITTMPAHRLQTLVFNQKDQQILESHDDISSGSALTDWTELGWDYSVPNDLSLGGNVGSGQMLFHITSNGDICLDAAYVRNALATDEPYLPDGNYEVSFVASEVFTEEENEAIHNAESVYGPRFQTVDLDSLDNHAEALAFAEKYFLNYALPIKRQRLGLVGYSHKILFPGELARIVGAGASTIADGDKPIITVSETLDDKGILWSNIDLERERPTPDAILRRLQKTSNRAAAVSGGFSGSQGVSSITSTDPVSGGGAEIEIEAGDGIDVAESDGTYTISNDGVLSIDGGGGPLVGDVTFSGAGDISVNQTGNNIEISATALTSDSTFGFIFSGGVQTNNTYGNAQQFITHATNAHVTLSFDTDTKIIYLVNGRPDMGVLTVSAPSGSLGGSWNLAYGEVGLFVAYDIGGGDFDIRRFL